MNLWNFTWRGLVLTDCTSTITVSTVIPPHATRTAPNQLQFVLGASWRITRIPVAEASPPAPISPGPAPGAPVPPRPDLRPPPGPDHFGGEEVISRLVRNRGQSYGRVGCGGLAGGEGPGPGGSHLHIFVAVSSVTKEGPSLLTWIVCNIDCYILI